MMHAEYSQAHKNVRILLDWEEFLAIKRVLYHAPDETIAGQLRLKLTELEETVRDANTSQVA
jgi:hypothetical protein